METREAQGYKKSILFVIVLLWASSGWALDVGKRFPPERCAIVDSVTGMTLTAITTDTTSDSKIYQTHPQWTWDGQYLIFPASRATVGRRQAFAYSETTGEIIQLTDGEDTQTGSLNVARKSNRIYYLRGRRGQSARLIELDLGGVLQDSKTGEMKQTYEREIMKFPEGMRESGGFTLDADEKVAYFGIRDGDRETGTYSLRKIDIQTGKMTTVIDLPFRIGHVQANPWVPGEILYCHETGGDAPQRMWLIQADGTGNQPLYPETPDEWVTHETWVDRDHVFFNVMAHLDRLRSKPHGIVEINVRSGEVVLHDQAPGKGYWHCAVTEDRKWAAGDTFTGELYLINLETGEKQLLTAGHGWNLKNRTHSHHNFSPDGKRILINSTMLGNADLITVPVPE